MDPRIIQQKSFSPNDITKEKIIKSGRQLKGFLDPDPTLNINIVTGPLRTNPWIISGSYPGGHDPDTDQTLKKKPDPKLETKRILYWKKTDPYTALEKRGSGSDS